MPTYEGFEIINQTAFRIASVAPQYSILRADFGDGYASTANVGMPGGVKAFTAVAGLWSDDEFYGTVDGQAWMEYYWSFLHARLQAGNEPFIIYWRGKYWLVDMDEPRFALEALKSFNSDMFVPATIRLNTRRVRGIEYGSDGSLSGFDPLEVPMGLALTLGTGLSILAEWDPPPDVEAPTVPVMTAPTGVGETQITWNWNASTDNTAVTGYDLQIATDAGFTAIVSTHNLGNVLTYTKTGLTAATQYYARVRAHDAVPNNSAYSSSTNATTTAGFTGLLDDLGVTATVAVGLRRLRGAYTGPLIRVRRVSDNAEQDIGYDGAGVLDWAAAISFKGASSLRVVTWYDQSGAANHLDANATAGSQPALDTTAEIIDFDGTDDFLWKSGVDLSATAKITMLGAGKFKSQVAGDSFMSAATTGANQAQFFIHSTPTIWIGSQNDGSGINGLYDNSDTSLHVFSMVCDRSLAAAAETKAYVDGVILGNVYIATEQSANFGASTYVSVGSVAGSSAGDIQAYEFILIPDALDSTDRAAAEADITTAYGI